MEMADVFVPGHLSLPPWQQGLSGTRAPCHGDARQVLWVCLCLAGGTGCLLAVDWVGMCSEGLLLMAPGQAMEPVGSGTPVLPGLI